MESEQIVALFAQTLTGEYDDESPWQAVHALHGLGSREVFDRAAEWCGSDNPVKRARGADVLAQLGKTADHQHNNFPEESLSVISHALQQEKDPLPLYSEVAALGHIGDPLAIPLVINQRLHPSSDIRFAVACALGHFSNDLRAADALLALMQDVDADVRDWATFGLGVLGDLDSGEIRDALYQRMTDSDRDAREEALVGLSKRQDSRVVRELITELSQPEVSDRVKEAAAFFVGEHEPSENRGPNDYAAVLRKHLEIAESSLQNRYHHAWQEYKRRRNQWLIVCLAVLPVSIFIPYLANRLHYPSSNLHDIVPAVMFVLFSFTLVHINLWRCPRCGKRFHTKFGLASFDTTRCCHCGLPKYSGGG